MINSSILLLLLLLLPYTVVLEVIVVVVVVLMQLSQRRPLTVPASSLGGPCDVAAVCRFPVTVTWLEMRITAVFATRHTLSHKLGLV